MNATALRFHKFNKNTKQIYGEGIFSSFLPSFSLPSLSFKNALIGATAGYAAKRAATNLKNWIKPNIAQKMAKARDAFKNITSKQPVKNQEQINQTAKVGSQKFETGTDTSLYPAENKKDIYMKNEERHKNFINKDQNIVSQKELHSKLYDDYNNKKPKSIKDIMSVLPKTSETGKNLSTYSSKEYQNEPVMIQMDEVPYVDREGDAFFDANGRKKRMHKYQFSPYRRY